MLRLLLTILTVFTLIVAGIWAFSSLEGEQGLVTIDYGDRIYEFTLIETVLILLLGLIVSMVAIWLFRLAYTIVLFILGDQTAINRFFARSREKRGMDALSQGMLAVATGDVKKAKRKAQKAEKLLDRPELTRLLNAEAAKLGGDEVRAKTYYKALAADKATAFVGVAGLLDHALASGDTDKALALAEKAHELNPSNPGMLEKLYTLQSQKFDWTAARATLKKQRRSGALPGPDADRREGALALAQAEDAEREGATEQARDLSVQAAKLDPSNAEAATFAARHLTVAGSKRAATKILVDAWTTKPDARIATAFAAIEPDESPAERRRRFQRLVDIHPDHPETHYMIAELALGSEDWLGARAALADLRETEPSARSCAIQAAIARGTGEPEHLVRGWLARALSAPRDGASDATLGHVAMLPLVIGGAQEGDEPTMPLPDHEPEADAADGSETGESTSDDSKTAA